MSSSPDPLMLGSLEKVGGAELRELRAKCMLLMLQDGEPTKFPGAQPVSFERKHLSAPEGGRGASIVTAPYFAAEKTDGVRYMLLILGSKGTFAVDRNFDMRRLPPMRFPTRTHPAKALDATLLDGELVLDTVGPGAKKRPRDDADGAEAASEPRLRYLAYDACCVGGRKCCDESLRVRLMLLRRDVLSPRFGLAQREEGAFESEHFAVELKDFFDMRQLPHIFSHVDVAAPGSSILYAYSDPLRKLSHGNDGIIFTPARDPYRPYTCPSLLKWKPSNMNSIDFQLQTKWRKGEPRFLLLVADQLIRQASAESANSSPTLCLLSSSSPRVPLSLPRFSPYASRLTPLALRFSPYASRPAVARQVYDWITFSEEDQMRFRSDSRADSRIIECVYDPNWHTIEYNPDDSMEQTWDNPYRRPGGWRFERIREDKNHPNDIRTVKSVEISVRDGVTATELLRNLGIRVAPGQLGAFADGAVPAHGAAPAPGAGPS